MHLSVCSCVPHPAQCQPSRKCCMIVECVCEAYPQTPLYILCNHLRSHGHGFRPHNPYVCTPRVFSGCWRALPLTSTLMICGTPFLSCPFAKILGIASWVNNLPSHLYFGISSGGGKKVQIRPSPYIFLTHGELTGSVKMCFVILMLNNLYDTVLLSGLRNQKTLFLLSFGARSTLSYCRHSLRKISGVYTNSEILDIDPQDA